MKKQIMTRAWKIAKAGQKKHGGKVSEYISEAMKMSWTAFKNAAAQTVIAKRQGNYIIVGVKDQNAAIEAFNGRRPAQEWEIKDMGVKTDVNGNEWKMARIEAHLTVKTLGKTITSDLNRKVTVA